jgi:hypothetical protein
MPRDRSARAMRRHGIGRRVAFLLLSGLPPFLPAATALAQDVPVAQPAAAHRFAAHIAEASQRFRIHEAWIRAVLDAESAYDIRAISDAGAMGLMQIMPDTWAELRVRHRLGDDPFDPRDNILAGTAYLREMLDRYGNVGAMLAAYNAGPGRYDEYIATGRRLPAETRAYVAKLAPLLGGTPLPDGTEITAPPPTDWREAPLFVVPADGGSLAGSLQPGSRSETETTTVSEQEDTTTSPPSEDIFVARSDGIHGHER